MKKCIFCLTTDGSLFSTLEHILPESLGGGDWAILPDGLYCDSCQNKFGSQIEQQALADYPFVMMRTLLGIPTKKKKAPWFKYWQGELHSGGAPGIISYEPNDFFRKAYLSGQKTQTIIPAVTKKPDMVLRMLLKIGLEVIASKSKEDVFSEQFNATREYALNGNKRYPWFYIQIEDSEMLNRYIKGVAWDDYHCFMDIDHYDNGLVVLHLRVFFLEFLVPLVENVELDPTMRFHEPTERVFVI